MPGTAAGVIFSDLDGTFLDAAYRPALDPATLARVAQRWRVIWVSSRTADELVQLQETFGHHDDAIGENGGVCVCSSEAIAAHVGEVTRIGDRWVARIATPAAKTLTLVHEALTAAGTSASIVNEFPPAELAARAGYSLAHAARALARRTSVLLADVDRGDPRTAQAFATLRKLGCTVVHGGHWVGVVMGADKGSSARAWLRAARATSASQLAVVAAIGNAENDASLLAVADQPFVIRAPDGGYLAALTDVPRSRRLTRPGTAGWSEMIELLTHDREDAR